MKNAKKAVGAIVAAAVGWLVLRTGLDVDPDTVIWIDTALVGLVVHQLKPIFGSDYETPKV